MYQLWGEPRFVEAPKDSSAKEKKETRTTKDGMILKDKSGTNVHRSAFFLERDSNKTPTFSFLFEISLISLACAVHEVSMHC
jgi:uncharacterized protein (DUF2461 family)